MADNNTILSNLYQLVNVDLNFQPTLIKNVYLPPPVGTSLGAVKAGANITIAADGTISATGGGGVVAYSATLTASYSVGTSLPYYNPVTTSTANWILNANGTTTTLAATISDGTTVINLTSGTSGTTAALLLTGLTIGGTATGTGSNMQTNTVSLSGTVPAVIRFVPAFFSQTSTNAPPAFTTTSNQTTSAAQGSTVTYPVASSATQYNWICTQRPLSGLMLVSPFGSSVLVPDVTAPTQTIAGRIFQVYGWTGLGVNTASVLQIT